VFDRFYDWRHCHPALHRDLMSILDKDLGDAQQRIQVAGRIYGCDKYSCRQNTGTSGLFLLGLFFETKIQRLGSKAGFCTAPSQVEPDPRCLTISDFADAFEPNLPRTDHLI
jgi:hypothetical protein